MVMRRRTLSSFCWLLMRERFADRPKRGVNLFTEIDGPLLKKSSLYLTCLPAVLHPAISSFYHIHCFFLSHLSPCHLHLSDTLWRKFSFSLPCLLSVLFSPFQLADTLIVLAKKHVASNRQLRRNCSFSLSPLWKLLVFHFPLSSLDWRFVFLSNFFLFFHWHVKFSIHFLSTHLHQGVCVW